MGIRTFIAIEIPDSLRHELSQLQQDLRESGADAKWVGPQNLHLTLKFLGDTPEEKIKDIKEVLCKIAGETGGCEVNFAGLGVFPKLDFPRVIWVGIEKGKENLIRLAGIIEERLSKLGFPEEKRTFSAHLTLGRVRSPKNKDRLKKIIEERTNFKAKNLMNVNKIILFRSQLTPQGPIYTKLTEFNLLNLS